MKTAVAETKSKKELDHKSEKIKSETKKFENEIKDPEKNEEKPGIFKRFFGWVKSIFSGSDEPNLAPEDTSRGNAQASSNAALQTPVNSTLSALETSPGADSGSAEPAISGENVTETVPQIPDNSAPNPGESSPQKSETAENAEKIKAAQKERETELESGKVSMKNMTFEVFKEEGYYFTKSGTVKVLGETVNWTAPEKINLGAMDGKFFGSGLISIDTKKLTGAIGPGISSELLIRDGEAHHLFRGSLCYSQDNFQLDLLNDTAKKGREFTDLDTIKTDEISLLNYSNTWDSSMKGSVTVNGSGLEGSAEGEILWFPKALFKGIENASKIKFGKNGSKLGFSLGNKDLKVSMGIKNAAELTGANPVTIDVDEKGKITYHLPKEYNINILSGLYTKEGFELYPIDLTMDKKLSEFKISDIDFSVGGAKTEGFSVGISPEEDKKSVSASMEKLTYKDLTIENLCGEIDGEGMTLGAENFEFEIGGKKLAGSVEELKWQPAATTFSVKKFELSVSELSFGENVTVEKTSVKFSLIDGKFSIGASGKFSKIEFSLGCVAVSSDELEVEFSFADGEKKADSGSEKKAGSSDKGEKAEEKKDEKTGFSATVNGSVNIKVGGDDPIIDTTVNKFSYEDGKFGVEELSVTTPFSKLISEKFSGTAAISTKNLEFSDKLEMDSLELGINGLAYNGKTLISSGTAAIIFREDKTEEPAKVDDGAKLEVGEKSEEGEKSEGGGATGILENASILVYLLENKKGAELSADGVNYEFDYLKMNFSGLKGKFFTKGGENTISAESAELKSGDKLNNILGVEELALTADNCKISSAGIELGKVSASAKSLTIANALNLSDIQAEMEFAEKMKFKSFHIHSSAKLGNFSVTDLDLKVSDDGGKTSAALEAQKIDCGGAMKNLEITDVKGSYSESGVTVDSAAFGFKIAGTAISGSVKNLTWSSENDFTAEKMEVAAGEFQISDGLKINSTSVTASVTNSKFSFGAKASFHVDAIDKGVIRIDETDLEFTFDAEKQKGGDGGKDGGGEKASEPSFSASAEGKIKVTIGDGIAAAELGDIKYADGEFSAGSFTAETDLSKFAGESLGGSASFSVNDLKFKKGQKPTAGSMGLKVSGVTYNEKPLMSDLSVDIVLDNKPGTAAAADTAEMALDDGLDGTLTGLKIEVHLTDQFRGVKMNADKFAVSPKNFSFEFTEFKGEFGTSSGSKVFGVKLGGASVKADLSDNEIAKYIGVESFEFTAEDVSIENNKFKVGKLSASADTEIALGSLTLTQAAVEAEFDDKSSLESLKLTCGVKYKDIAEGSATVTVTGEGVTFNEIKDFRVSYGCFTGGLTGIKKDNDNDNVTFENLSLAKTSGSESQDEFEENEKGTFVSKFLKSVPNIGITIKELKIENGTLKKPSLDDISIDKFEKEFELGKNLKGSVGYTGGEKGKFSVKANADFSLQKENKEEKIPILKAGVYIVPGLVGGELELGFIASLGASLELNGEIAREDKKVNIESGFKTQVKGDFGIYGAAQLTANAIIVKATGGLQLSLDFKPDVNLDGSLGISYDPDAAKFSEAFSLNKEKTKVNYDLSSTLVFAVKMFVELKGFPILFRDKKLYHSWDLLNYEIAGAKLKGAVAYDSTKKKYAFTGKPEFTYAGKADYQPKVTQDQLDTLGNDLAGLQDSMKKIDKALKAAQGGINPAKGSIDGIAGDLGADIDAKKDALMPELRKRIDDTFQKGKEKSLKCHILMTDLAKMINDNSDKLTENQRNVEALERIIGESKTALGITGFKADSEFTADKYREYIEELKKLKTDEERLDKLSELEPAAVVNMFKAFKLGKTASWEGLHDKAKGLTAEQVVNDVPDEEYKSLIKPEVYETAMNDLGDLLAKRQAKLTELENLYNETIATISDLQKKQDDTDEENNKIIILTIREMVQLSTQMAENNGTEAPSYNAFFFEIYKHKKLSEKAANSLLTLAMKEGAELVGVAKTAKEKMDQAIGKAEQAKKKEIEKNGEKAKTRAEKSFEEKKKKAMDVYNKSAENGLKNNKTLLPNILHAAQTLGTGHYAEEIAHQENQKSKYFSQLTALKGQLMASGDISTAMKVFQEFASTEYKRTTGNLDKAQKKYGLTPKTEQTSEKSSSKISDEEKQKRRENVLSVIDRLIEDATDENLKSFDSSRHTERLKTLQDQSGIVDVNMRGFGLPEHRKSNTAFNTMRSDNEKFQTMKKQLDEAYKELTGYHDLIRQVLESWNTVNGLKFEKRETAAAFSEGSGKVVDLIGEIDEAEKKAVSEETLSKISNEVKALNINEPANTDEQSAPADQTEESRKLGIA